MKCLELQVLTYGLNFENWSRITKMGSYAGIWIEETIKK